jgi:hypothetical protein
MIKIYRNGQTIISIIDFYSLILFSRCSEQYPASFICSGALVTEGTDDVRLPRPVYLAGTRV